MAGEIRLTQVMARHVVETVAGVQLVFRDGANVPPKTYDFDVMRGGKLVAALAVTMLLDESRQRLSTAFSAHSFAEAPNLRSAWVVTFGADAFEGRPMIKDLGPQLVPLLETLEDLGMDFVSLDFSDLSSGMSLMRPRERSVYASLAQLSVYRAMTTDSEHPPGLYLVEASADLAAQGSYAHQTIELALLAGRFQRERDRLRRSVTPERHLFIWLSATLYDARKGLASSDRPPNEAPTLPDDITTLWVAALSQPDRLVTWRSSGDSWERFDP